MGLTGNTNEEKIWNYLLNHFQNKIGISGLMGNLKAESGLSPINLQDSFEKKIGLNDTSYTQSVDKGNYTNFVEDGAGYGLAQWTFWSRKKALLNYAKSKNISIGDLEMQLEFLINELKTDYSKSYEAIKNGKNIREVSNMILADYEGASNATVSTQSTRANYSQDIYDKYSGIKVKQLVEKNQELLEFFQESSFSQYLTSTGTHYISNSGKDENGNARGGKAGDQTGNEWTLRGWYSSPWNCVLRYPDPAVGRRIAELGCQAAFNNKIGYDQNERSSYWFQLQKAGYHPDQIKTACEADCSAGVIANVKAVGYLMNISKLKDIKATYTGDMRQSFTNAGFQVLTDNKYTNGTSYLLPGDILLNDVKHTATNITLGYGIRNASTIVDDGSKSDLNNNVLRVGSVGIEVKEMQTMLIALGYDCGSAGADGDFGQKTFQALRQYQRDKNLVVDGIYGPNS